MSVVIVIPAYQPGALLIETLEGLAASGYPVVVVNDGSAEECRTIFSRAAAIPNVEVIEHAVNLGKGAALRAGMNHALCRYRRAQGVVTADADGQHRVADILAVARDLEGANTELVLGVRQFPKDVPLRSRIGNSLTRILFRALYGQDLRDTQTGLRGVPRALAETMLRSRDSGYEFELDMLIAAKQLGVGFRQVGIETVYIEGNASSHFNPILDSMRIYFVLLRFSFASVLTAVCDNLVFFAVLSWLGAPLPAQVAARLAAVVLHFNLNKRIVFLFRGQGNPVMHRYLGVVAVSGLISYLSLMSLHQMAGVPVITAKILVEGILFLANFVLLRDFVFTSKRQTAVSTDWTAYYKSVPWTARLTRRYTSRCILQALRLAGFGPGRRRPEVYEFGGGNSCFLEPIASGIRPASYHVVDTNPLGLDLLRRRTADATLPVVLHQDDILRLDAPEAADVVFSVGLIEHFEPSGTARCVSAHFDTVKPGGWVLVSFPTPTWLYRFIRGALELAGLWKFQDERPLDRDEVMRAAGSHAELAWEKTLWPLGLTQHMMLFRKTVKRSEAGWQAFTLPVTVARESDPARHRQRAHTEPGGEIDGLHHEELAPGVRQ